MELITIIRGGGELASGVALRLHRSGLPVIMLELPEPLVVRRTVSFAEAVFSGKTRVEEVEARLVEDLDLAFSTIVDGCIPIVVDPDAGIIRELVKHAEEKMPFIVIDARMTKRPPEAYFASAEMVIGLGPGFAAGENCDAVVETKRGHTLGRVYWRGSCAEDTGLPEGVQGMQGDRVLRAPADGVVAAFTQIGAHLNEGDLVAEVNGVPVYAPFKGTLRGLVHSGVSLRCGTKLGDIDPRDDPSYCHLVSDKALAVGGGVMEAILSNKRLRYHLWKLYAAD